MPTNETIVSEAIESAMSDESSNKGDPELRALGEEVEETRQRTIQQKLASERNKEDAERRKQDREAGRVAAASAFEKRAKEFGFSSLDEMFAQVAERKAPKVQTSEKSERSVDNSELQAALSENRTLKNQIRGLRSRIEVLESELELREDAYRADINPDDLDYALSQVQTHFKRISKENPKEAENFKVSEFFTKTLKEKKPSIFRQKLEEVRKIEEVPVSTAASDKKPEPPRVQEVVEGEAKKAELPNAMTMSREQIRKELAKRGIRHYESF